VREYKPPVLGRKPNCYICNKTLLRLGFELGVGHETLKYKQIEVEIIDNNVGEYEVVNGTDEDNNTTYPSSKSSDFRFYYNSSIRLGVYL